MKGRKGRDLGIYLKVLWLELAVSWAGCRMIWETGLGHVSGKTHPLWVVLISGWDPDLYKWRMGPEK